MRRVALLAAVLVVAAGCGSSPRHALGDGASFVPANTVAFLSARADADWQPLARQVVHRVPKVPRGADEVDLAVLQGGKLVVLAHVHGRWRGAPARPPKPSLADDAHYLDSLHALPDEPLVQVYVRGDVTGKRLAAIPGALVTTSGRFTSGYRVTKTQVRRFSTAFLRWGWGAAWLTGDGLGARAGTAGLPLADSSFVRSLQRLAPAYAPLLFDEIPGDAIAVLDLPVPLGTFQALGKAPPALRRLFPKAGIALLGDLDAIVGGETALYARPGGELTLVTSPFDVRSAEQALDDLGAKELHRAVIGGQLVLSTTAAGIAAFRGGGAKLSGEAGFKHAGLPARASAFAYVRSAYRGLRPLAAWSVADGRDATFTVRFLR